MPASQHSRMVSSKAFLGWMFMITLKWEKQGTKSHPFVEWLLLLNGTYVGAETGGDAKSSLVFYFFNALRHGFKNEGSLGYLLEGRW